MRRLISLFFLGCITVGGLISQEFSDPVAPVGDKNLTVPEYVTPILDYWIRDPFIMLGPDDTYYMVATTADPNREFPGNIHCWDYNDGLYMWKSEDLKNWDEMGLVWSFDDDAADWQKKPRPVKPGAKTNIGDPLDSIFRAVWAPELHYIKDQWLLVACINRKGGSFILKSTSGKPEGPYVNIEGNKNGPIYKNIDLSLFEDDNGDVYAVAHNHYIAKMKNDLSGLAEDYRKIKETPYNPEPYIEGIYIIKHNGKYQLLQTVWSLAKDDGTYTYIKTPETKNKFHSYDVVVAESDNIYGPYGPRYTAIQQGGHNNVFADKNGDLWSTLFFNPKGEMAKQFPVTCRMAIVAVKFEDGKLMPDHKRTKKFYKGLKK